LPILIKDTAKLQTELYAANGQSLLIIFQAMDAAGKDSAIAHTMSGLNPQGCQVYSFKQPTSEDYEHDFLWRHYKALPERGRIGIHNRSHYENVLVTKVHPEFILKENIPGITKVKDIGKKFWDQRYESIRDFEKHLSANGTVIIKFFLHLSKDEQKKRFLKRIADPEKNWKFSSGDIKERQLWGDYMKAYETAIQRNQH
jgi:PPK2 family polyphosphate:nucleotide phosphotransferase